MVRFDWDEGNRAKCQKHGVSLEEIEYVLSRPFAVRPSPTSKEQRSFAIGKTSEGRYIFIVFMTRREYIRAISARYMHRKEVQRYEEEA
jgi:uncharacterized DUF497 family protein